MNIEQEFQNIQLLVKDASQSARDFFTEDIIKRELKADGSVVTKVDREIETILLTYIQEHFPNDTIVGEEYGNHEGSSGFVWHIDPIDGTGNFLRKIPFCCVSVARLGDTPEDSFALIYNPFTDHMFSSLMENGTYLNERIIMPEAESLEGGKQAISVAAGSRDSWMKPARYKMIADLGLKYGKATSYGSCALELAYIAANRIDAQITFGLNTYDYAAGLFLVKAAGGAISVFEHNTWNRWEGSIKSLCDVHGKVLFSSHPDVHDGIRDFIGDPKRWSDA